MSGSIRWLAAGILIGGTVMTITLSHRYDEDAGIEALDPVGGSSGVPSVSVPRWELPDAFASYATAALISEPAAIETKIARLSAAPRPRGNDIELEALVLRLGELDLKKAVRFARAMRFDKHLLVPLLSLLAESDVEAAIGETALLIDPASRRAASLALLDVIGSDASSIERIAVTMPESGRLSFLAEALAQHARSRPAIALDHALALDDSAARQFAVERIAAQWGLNDAESALRAADSIAESLKDVFRVGVLRAWATLDPDGALAELEAAEWNDLLGSLPGREALERLAAAIPMTVYESADRLPAGLSDTARIMALDTWGEQRPTEALDFAESISGRYRNVLLGSIARGMARDDPRRALDWMQSLDPPPRSVAVETLAAIAQVDFDLALQIAFQSPNVSGYSTVAALPLDRHPERIPAILRRLTTAGSAFIPSVAWVLSQWVRAQPARAVNWAATNESSIDEATFRFVAASMAQRDAMAAANLVGSLPADLRETWISGIATNFASQDPGAAVELLLGLPKGADRDQTIGRVIGVLLATVEPIDPALMQAISSDQGRDRAIREALPYIQSGNAEQAEKLRDYIDDDSLLAEFDRALAFARGN